MLHRHAGLPVLVVLSLAAGLAAQAPPPPPPGQTPPQTQQPTFRARIDSVSVDVTVTDRQGNPVTDLTPDDFEIREDNRPQAIETFKLVRVDDTRDPALPRASAVRSLEDQERETARDDVRLVVIFLDDYHTRLINSMRIREQLASWVTQLHPLDMVAVVLPLTPATALTFSRNHDATARILLGFTGRKYDYTPRNPLEERFLTHPPESLERMRNEIVIAALESLCRVLGSLRDGRKTILYVGEGMTGTLPPGVSTRGVAPRLVAPREADDQVAFFQAAELLNRMREVFVSAARSNTAIYTLDPRGLATSEYDMEDRVSEAVGRRALQESTDLLRVLADQTDGRAIVARNNPLPGLQQMVRDSSAYYLIGYTSSQAPRDGKFHEIQVRVKRPGVEVRARKGYWAYTEEMAARAEGPARTGPPPDVVAALESLNVPPRGRSVRLWIGTARGPDEHAVVTLVWEPAPAAGPVESWDVVDRISVVATSVDGDLLFRGPVPRESDAVRAGRLTFQAPAGDVHLRITAENARGQRIDTDDRVLRVPDFSGPWPVVSTPAVFRARTARDVQTLRANPAPVPTPAREFSRTERLLLRFEAYGPGGTTPALALTLLNQLGDRMTDLPEPVRRPDGSYEVELVLGGLRAGDYLIEIAARSPAGDTRQLLGIRISG